MKAYISFITSVIGVLAFFYAAEACNEALCAPLVSKCMLIKCCECDMTDKKNCTCCRDCQICLSQMYTECCSCVGLCPLPDPDDDIYRGSTVEVLPDPIPDLFGVLTELEDPEQRWTTYSFSYNLESYLFKPGTGYTPELDSFGTDSSAGLKDLNPNTPDIAGLMGIHNCSTAFFSQCMSMAKCKNSCKSMGAAKYRWFHEGGCCQCIGNTCLDFGLDEPQCLKCPSKSYMSKESGYKDGDTGMAMNGAGNEEESLNLANGISPGTA